MAKKRTAAKRAAKKTAPAAPAAVPTTRKGEPLPRATFTMVVSFDRALTADLSDGEVRDLMDGVINLANERGSVLTALVEWAPTDIRTEVLVG